MHKTAITLTEKYKPANRYKNFGHVVSKINIDGFRGISGLEIEPEFPVLAISGLNGSGKSTIGQILTCAYKVPSTAVGYKRYYIKDFFPLSVLDPSPFTNTAKAVFSYETINPAARQEVTISRANTEWSGYKRQPERLCYYVGFTLYLPKNERRDLSVYRAATLELRTSSLVSPEVSTCVSQILNQAYQNIHFQKVGHGTKESELGVATKFGASYSENHMGFGEGRVLYMVHLMESAPEQSLFILEEPETSLHEEAQFRLARYFLEVANRRHHQIIITTHSNSILEALPPKARAFIYRDLTGVTVYPEVTSTRARAILSGGFQRALTVAVEDEFAKLVLESLIRKIEPTLLKAINIVVLGSADAVKSGVKLVKKIGHKAIGVRDGDMPANPGEGLFVLPGTLPPEKEVFNSPTVIAMLLQDFGIDVAAFMAANPIDDHHDIPRTLAEAAETNETNLSCCAIRAYVDSLPDTVIQTLVQNIRANT